MRTKKKIIMLNNGGKNLDQTLSMRIIGSSHRGLGYQQYAFKSSLDVSKPINFVKSTTSHEKEAQKLKIIEQ